MSYNQFNVTNIGSKYCLFSIDSQTGQSKKELSNEDESESLFLSLASVAKRISSYGLPPTASEPNNAYIISTLELPFSSNIQISISENKSTLLKRTLTPIEAEMLAMEVSLALKGKK